MQFSNVLSLVFATIVAAQDVATLFSEPNFQGTTYTISGSDDAIGQCNPVTGFPIVQSIKVNPGFACDLFNKAECGIPYAAYSGDEATTIVFGAFSAYSCAVAVPGGPFN
ncbi:hypothetical protein ACHAQJ_002500 [Trichoderma viride]